MRQFFATLRNASIAIAAFIGLTIGASASSAIADSGVSPGLHKAWSGPGSVKMTPFLTKAPMCTASDASNGFVLAGDDGRGLAPPIDDLVLAAGNCGSIDPSGPTAQAHVLLT